MTLGPGWRHAGATAGLLLAACQPLPHPFANDIPKPGSPILAVRDAATVAVAPLAGGPRATARKLAPAVAEALQKRDIAASDRARGLASYQLEGRLQAMPRSGDQAAIVVSWVLRDPAGKSLGARAERIEAAAGDWETGNDSAVARLADASAGQIAAMLLDKPPAEAAPDDRGGTRLRIGNIEGAPGDGATALTRAITALLQRQGVALADDPKGPADLLLDAKVTVDKAVAGKQHVKIVWRVRRTDGREIGTAVQENDVPAGLLDGPWADVAFSVADAAQDGIMQLIAHGRPQASGNP
jgi:hypothetical protein